jgi:hypothetical protein
VTMRMGGGGGSGSGSGRVAECKLREGGMLSILSIEDGVTIESCSYESDGLISRDDAMDWVDVRFDVPVNGLGVDVSLPSITGSWGSGDRKTRVSTSVASKDGLGSLRTSLMMVKGVSQ